jgi:hypothetical protein
MAKLIKGRYLERGAGVRTTLRFGHCRRLAAEHKRLDKALVNRMAGRGAPYTTMVALPVKRAPPANSLGKHQSSGRSSATAVGRIAQWASADEAYRRGAKLRRQAAA